jgi:hypothetical protein
MSCTVWSGHQRSWPSNADTSRPVAERSAVALHVLPEGVNMGVWGAFDIATGDSTITVRMSGIEDVTSTDRDLVSKAAVAFERILGAALPRSDSLSLIRSAEGQWKAQI